MEPSSLRGRLHHLYHGTQADACRFRYGVLAFDLATIGFVIATSFLPRSLAVEAVDVLVGLVLVGEFAARVAASRVPWREALRPASLVDALAIASFLAPLAGEGLGFLRVLRTLRLVHSYRMLGVLRRDFAFFRRHEEAFLAATHLLVFIFVMTALVYETQHAHNEQISHYADALYFTVTALTTTGFGDITLPGTTGRLISVVIMIAGVTLFLRLAQALFRPSKVRFACPSCGLSRHEPDAVHCKACGTLLNIPDEGRE
ncbi:potassium channel family protein [Roseomonas sp. PWR1]|uniref:Potassium channel family protein n=1 Tax=Roseomonas nitratireducens TaxID=2820810 RepID=A0ABS4AZ61_9PROT|nr:potassium channel family protein [Neoroseomonas nitratireducens]MBP0466668.1 potassium channel family protein [Neoroseomonas nitratireducens]